MSESINFAALQEFLDNQRSTEYISVHALDHWNQVEFNGLLLAPHTGADILVVRLFSLFHDSRRLNDYEDPEHGERGAELAKELRNKMFELSDEQFDLLYTACKNHTHVHFTGNPTIDTCFDADRLDLGRVGILPNPDKMATAYGKKLAKKIQEENVSFYHVREWLSKLEF
ncbi:MAG: hypothetical protein UH678_02370 [Fibrobacteraceae bacterium]|jgi:uncharacterized protein|nr:hypothetical protein [Fibrobacteraceae bacterium]